MLRQNPVARGQFRFWMDRFSLVLYQWGVRYDLSSMSEADSAAKINELGLSSSLVLEFLFVFGLGAEQDHMSRV